MNTAIDRAMRLLPALLPLMLTGLSSCEGQPRFGKDDNVRIVSAMTLDEKVRFVVGTCTSRAMPPETPPGLRNRAGYPGGENTFSTQNQVPGAAGDGFSIPRLGIPAIVYADGPAGLRIDPRREDDDNTYWCTAFPAASLLASAWDDALVERVGAAIGEEVLHYGVDILLAPGMNIQRNPLTGRNFEYYSEDPLLCGRTAAAYVKGVQSQGVGTSVKHFAVNNQERYRNGIDAQVSERALRELYLRGFEIAVKASAPWTVMSSYNKVNGTFASENRWLLDTLLRREWGFTGFVMTDWWGADDPVAQMEAGNDLLMPGSPYQIEELTQAVLDGRLPEAVLDRNVKRILDVIARTPKAKGYRADSHPDLDAHAALSREAAAAGMVLLYNDGALPVKNGSSVALFGNYAYDTQPCGSGSGYVNKAYKITLDQGLEAAGLRLDAYLAATYRDYIRDEKAQLPPEYFWVIPTAEELEVSDEQIERAAGADCAIVTLGRMSGEGDDRRQTEGDYLLSRQEKSLLTRVYRQFHPAGKKVILVLNTGAPVELTDVEAISDAILLAWIPGQEAGHAMADILTGRVNPSGKLPVSFARSYDDLPSAANFGVSPGETSAVRYEEDLMIGYRYFVTSGRKPLYPFGHGLSYTDFAYSDLSIDGQDVSIRIENTGAAAGREIVQFYVQKPPLGTGRPTLELCAYAKTQLLAPGASETLRVRLNEEDLRQFEDGKWQTAAGEYTLFAGASSEDLRLNVKFEQE